MLRNDVISEILTFLELPELLRSFVLVSKSFLAIVNNSLTLCSYVKVLSSNLSKVVEKCPNIKHLCLIFKEKYKAQEIAPAFDSFHQLTRLWLVFIDGIQPVFPLKHMIGLQNLLGLERVYLSIPSVSDYFADISVNASVFDKQKHLLIKDLSDEEKKKGFSEDLLKTEIFIKIGAYFPKCDELTESLQLSSKHPIDFYKFQKLTSLGLYELPNNLGAKADRIRDCRPDCDRLNSVSTIKKLSLSKVDRWNIDSLSFHLKHEGIKNLKLFLYDKNPFNKLENSIINVLQQLPNLEKLTLDIKIKDPLLLTSLSIHLIALVLSSNIKRINGVPVKDFILSNPCHLSINLNSFETTKPIAYALLAYFIAPLSKIDYVRIRENHSTMNYGFKALETLAPVHVKKLKIIKYLLDAEKNKSHSISSYLSAVLSAKPSPKLSQKQRKHFEGLSIHIEEILNKQFSYEEMIQQLKAKRIFFYGHTELISCIIYIDAYSLIATGSDDNLINLFDSKSFRFIKTLSGHLLGVKCLNYFQNQLISGSYDSLVKIWDLNSFSEIMSFSGHTSWITAVLITESNLPVSASCDCSVRIWSLATLNHKSTVLSLEVWKELVITGCGDFMIYVWNIGSYQLLRKIDEQTSPVLFIKNVGERLYTIGKNGQQLVLSLPEFIKVSGIVRQRTPIVGFCVVGNTVAYYNASQVEVISKNRNLVKKIEDSKAITDACFIDENTLACVLNNDCIIYWNLETNDKVRIWSAQQLASQTNPCSVDLFMKYLRVNKQF